MRLLMEEVHEWRNSMSVYGGPDIITDNLVLCLDAANPKSYPGSGTLWYDLSGNNKNVTWGSVSWDSSGYFNTLSNRATGVASNSFGIDNSTGYTIFFIFQTVSGSNNGAFKFQGSGLPSSSTRGIFCHPGWSTDTIFFDQGGCCGGDQRISYTNSNVSESNIWNIVGLRSNISSRSILYNGIQATNTATPAANTNLDSNPILINPGDEGYNWHGKLAYFAAYNRPLLNNEYINKLIYNTI